MRGLMIGELTQLIDDRIHRLDQERPAGLTQASGTATLSAV
jgi:hypothetical protein